jgi:SAM-dependent methyltransferase
MHPDVFALFDLLCRDRIKSGGRVLEVGAMPADDTLLNLPALRDAALRVGTNLSVRRAWPGVTLIRVAADGLACLGDSCFDAVLCNSVLEHDPRFWVTCAGIMRVARPGALIALGVPGYADLAPPPLTRLARRLARLPLCARLFARLSPGWEAATPTLAVHDFPGDYYRFSAQAMREVLMAGCRDVEVRVIMRPPRIIGVGVRTDAPPGAAAPPWSA